MIIRQKIMITGANGQLGEELQRIAAGFPQFEFIFLTKQELMIEDREAVYTAFEIHRPHYLVNCAAYTAVDKAEENEKSATIVNATATGVLASACKEFNCLFIHISTDYVFDGRASQPYSEEDRVNPQTVYGRSKSIGEDLSLKLNPDSIVIRTSWVYAETGKNFVKTMLRLMAEKKEINVVNDQVGSPTWTFDLAEAILQIISSKKWQPGIYHFSNAGHISWFDFAVAIKEITGSSCNINPVPSSAYPTVAARPAYSVLNTGKIKEVFGIELKHWKHSLKQCLSRIDIESGIN